MRHTIILHKDGQREFRKGYDTQGTDNAETISHPYLKDYQVEEIMQATSDKVQELLKKYF
jgi:hypothetical protein